MPGWCGGICWCLTCAKQGGSILISGLRVETLGSHGNYGEDILITSVFYNFVDRHEMEQATGIVIQ